MHAIPNDMGVQLSWQSIALTRRGSGVRTPQHPPCRKLPRSGSSVGQNTGLSRRGSRVRVPSAAPFLLPRLSEEVQKALSFNDLGLFCCPYMSHVVHLNPLANGRETGRNSGSNFFLIKILPVMKLSSRHFVLTPFAVILSPNVLALILGCFGL